MVEDRVWRAREECEQRKIEAMERMEDELAAVKGALQAALARYVLLHPTSRLLSPPPSPPLTNC